MRRYTIVVLMMLLVVVLAPAGGDQEASRSAGDEADMERSKTADQEPVTVTIGYNRFLQSSFTDAPAPLKRIRQEVSKRYSDIDVKLNILPDKVTAMRDAISVWMTARDGTVDIYGMDTPWVTQFGEAGWAEPLGEAIPELRKHFVETGLQTFSHEGKVLGVPFWGSISGLYYRADLLEEYGFEPPTTLEEMLRIADTITEERPELTAFTWPGAKAESLVMVFADMLHGFGGSYRSPDGSYAFSSPEAREALGFMTRLIEEGYSPEQTTAWRADESRKRFVQGKALFTWHNSDLVTWLDDPERSEVVGDWGFIPSPARPEGRRVGVTGGFAFALNPHSDTPEAAMKVMRVLSSRPIQKAFALAWGPVQYYEGLYEDPEVREANPNASKITQVLEHAVSRPPSNDYAQLSSILQQELHAAVTGGKTPRAALRTVSRRVEQLR